MDCSPEPEPWPRRRGLLIPVQQVSIQLPRLPRPWVSNEPPGKLGQFHRIVGFFDISSKCFEQWLLFRTFFDMFDAKYVENTWGMSQMQDRNPTCGQLKMGNVCSKLAEFGGLSILGLPNQVAIKHLCLWAGGQASAPKFDLGMVNLAKHG